MKLENYPVVEKKLVDVLKEKFPNLEYQQDLNSEQFAREAAKRAGAIEIIRHLESVYKAQQKVKKEGR
tara:strand:- start:1337 stop:1540 length:204 start_codon:yes stop_codon:yes gene_type:complete